MPRPKKIDPVKNCQFCGKQLMRKIINGRLEDRGIFLKRKYCNQDCMAKAFIKKNVEITTMHKRAQKYKKTSCQICGATTKLQVHHQDGNPMNNALDNLITLCGSCHLKWHWTHGKKNPKRQTVCKICGEPSRKLDMCQKHYQRFRKYGDPYLTKKKIGSKYELVQDIPGVKNGQGFQE